MVHLWYFTGTEELLTWTAKPSQMAQGAVHRFAACKYFFFLPLCNFHCNFLRNNDAFTLLELEELPLLWSSPFILLISPLYLLSDNSYPSLCTTSLPFSNPFTSLMSRSLVSALPSATPLLLFMFICLASLLPLPH